jgi:hypothetical protein
MKHLMHESDGSRTLTYSGSYSLETAAPDITYCEYFWVTSFQQVR